MSQANTFNINQVKFLLTWSRIATLVFDTVDHDSLLRELMELIKSKFDVRYCCVSIEKHHINDQANENGEIVEEDDGVHFHAVVRCNSKPHRSVNGLMFYDQIPNVQYLRTNDDLKRAIAYVKKDGKWIEWGDAGINPKLKFAELKQKIKSMELNEYADKVANNLTEVRAYKELRPLLTKPYRGVRKLYWFFGKTGCGKTRKAWEIIDESNLSSTQIVFSGKRFVNNYAGEKVVLIDDLRKSDIELNVLLKMLDRYPYTVDTKGSFANWDAEVIIITSHFCPKLCYSFEKDGVVKLYDNADQLVRRLREFGETRYFYKEGDEFRSEVVDPNTEIATNDENDTNEAAIDIDF